MNDTKTEEGWPTAEPLGWSSPSRYGVCHLIVTKPGDPYDTARTYCREGRKTGGQIQTEITANVCRACAKSPLLKTAFKALQRPRCEQRRRPDPKDRTYSVQCTKPLHHDGKHVTLATIDGTLREFRWVSGEKNQEQADA